MSVRQRKPHVLRSRSAAFRLVALSAVLACASAAVVFYSSPSWAEEGGNGNGGGDGNNGGGKDASGAASGSSSGSAASSSGGGSHSASPHSLWVPNPNPAARWLSNSAARIANPLAVFFKGAQRATAHAASDLAKTGRAIGAPLNWLAGKVKTPSNDQDKAMAAVRRGEIVPLENVLETVEKSVPGDVLGVDLSHDVVGSWNYKITVLTPQGYYRDVNVDAGSNNVTSIRSH